MNRTDWQKAMIPYSIVDDETAQVACLCGYNANLDWDLQIGVMPTDAERCPKCGLEYYYEYEIHIFVREPVKMRKEIEASED